MTGEDERIEMEIRKRNGESVPFQQEKIFNAMKKAFDGQGKEIGSREMDEILATVLNNLSVTVPLTVERVQDEVERTLMERGHYEVAKAYILYREKRSALRRVRIQSLLKWKGFFRDIFRHIFRCRIPGSWPLPPAFRTQSRFRRRLRPQVPYR